ncbi:MAG: hypothetical protein IPK85_09105 [Gemmatimonadetes bacterium]|nr:hypothetical protein [Gemmatimonadota bacterium]
MLGRLLANALAALRRLELHWRWESPSPRASAVLTPTGAAVAALRRGTAVLAPLLESHGFRLQAPTEGRGSGGPFAWTTFVRGTRALELHQRFGLGIVLYRDAAVWLEHGGYMRALGADPTEVRYPGFDADPLAAYAAVLADLQRYAAEFLRTDAPVLRAAGTAAAESRATAHRSERSAWAGDLERRARARDAFRARRYGEACAELEAVTDPELLMPSEREMWRLAAERGAPPRGTDAPGAA